LRCDLVAGFFAAVSLACFLPAKYPAVGLADLVRMAAWGGTAARGAPALDLLVKIRRFTVADPPLAVIHSTE
jgi:hypothetical protein